eukprot:TRINITY_DN436_c0_g1_i4.p2 TRINITY_DN436_c0_g1~~TRINITY_DN436_c0_g1_i4.p2  ORF type:complete len:113 (-),score=8.17 TRINITY_DN436_c0_g1_i4:219-557(-)
MPGGAAAGPSLRFFCTNQKCYQGGMFGGRLAETRVLAPPANLCRPPNPKKPRKVASKAASPPAAMGVDVVELKEIMIEMKLDAERRSAAAAAHQPARMAAVCATFVSGRPCT